MASHELVGRHGAQFRHLCAASVFQNNAQLSELAKTGLTRSSQSRPSTSVLIRPSASIGEIR
jgi:hypothetical protein